MLYQDYYVKDFHPHDDMPKDVEIAICTALLAPMSICVEKHYHVSANDGEFRFEYASKKDDLRPEADFYKLDTDDTLFLSFYEINLEPVGNDKEIPTVKRHVMTIQMFIIDDEGRNNRALVCSLFRYFATTFFKMIDKNSGRFVAGTAYIGDENILP